MRRFLWIPPTVTALSILSLYHATLFLLLDPCLLVGRAHSLQEAADGDATTRYREGMRLFQQKRYDEAALSLWYSILHHNQSPVFTLEEAFTSFIQCYAVRGIPADGYVFIAKEYIRRGMEGMDFSEEAIGYLSRALEIAPDHEEARRLLSQLKRWKSGGGGGGSNGRQEKVQKNMYEGKTVEEWYEMGNNQFNEKNMAAAAVYFERSCQASGESLGPACGNAVFCRTQVLDWGPNGSKFEADMERIDALMHVEQMTHAQVDPGNDGGGRLIWQRTTSVHPHMMLGYPLDARLQRVACESYAATDEMRSRIQEDPATGEYRVVDLPPGFPYDQSGARGQFLVESKSQDFKIRLGIVSSAIKSTAVLYLTNEMFQFFDKSRFEIHVFASSPPDNPLFIERATSGVDWRKNVRRYADHFHEVEHIAENHVELAKLVHGLKMHIMMDWDGYARQGSRPQGLFALRPAPIQIFHQEFLGTSGATYVDYLVSDQRVSPPMLADDLYTEKLIYMPNHFFSKGHALMEKMLPPEFDYRPAKEPYVAGSGSPQENRCLSPPGVGPTDVSFVYCNFHKFLKYNPDTLRAWLSMLEAVPGSILCLLQNPVEGVPNLRKFVDEIDPDLNSRIHFVEWSLNLFDHQRRNRDLCNVVLDTFPYNGHTTTMDALYAGVPVVARSDLDHMAARVTASANIVLELEEMNADGLDAYRDLGIWVAKNTTMYNSVRRKLIDSCLQTKPTMHPFWDVKRYVRDFEIGLTMAWERYLAGNPPEHIVIDSDSIYDRNVEGSNKEASMEKKVCAGKACDEL